MSTTARPQQLEAIHRTVTLDSNVSSSDATPVDSPFDSPRPSASSTSLSSLGSAPGEQLDEPLKQPTYIDGRGNEFVVPDYTIKQIRDAIPAHCFERLGLTGLSYVARDVFCLAMTFYIFYNYVTPETVPSHTARVGLWAVYTFIQGLFGTGLWVLAHECGHQSFSPSKTLNDTVGWICHSALLVPYFSWKISHGKHHKATGNMERDMVFVPPTREEYTSGFGKLAHEVHELMEDAPIYTLWCMLKQQVFGWPMYLLTNVTGHNYHERQVEGKGKGRRNGFRDGINHFIPSSPLYEQKDEHLVLLSDLGLAIMGSILFFIGSRFGWSNLLIWYIVPYLWVNHWLGKNTLF